MGQTPDRIILTPDLKTKLKAVMRHLKDGGRKGRIKWSDCVDHIFQKNKDLRKEVRELKAGQPEVTSTVKEQTPTVDPTKTHPCPHYSFDPAIERVLCSKDFNRGSRIHKIPQEVCDKHWEQIKKTWTEQDISDVECLSRYEDKGAFFCVKNPPKAVKLLHALKTCRACPDRLTKDRAEHMQKVLQTHYFVNCGAKESEDRFYCKKKEGGKWVTIDHCKKKECEFLKTYQTT